VLGPQGEASMLEDADNLAMSAKKWKAKNCCFCDCPLSVEDGTAILMGETCVWDYDHFTEETQGVGHSSCNIKASLQKHYMVFHNL